MNTAESEARLPVAIGGVIQNKYRIERILGVGGMGCVVAATHLQLNELVAIKFLLPEVASLKEVHGRFLREARAAVRVKSEHVVRVSDVGELPNGEPFMVMEYLHGQSLSELLESKGPLSAQVVADYVLQACEALSEAHGLGIVHRDLKPSNLFLCRRSDGSACIKVLDFGISKQLSTADLAGSTLTATNQILGSPHYMSPEQLRSARDVDARSDIWSMGAVMFELLTGTLPFARDSFPALFLAIVQDEPADLSQLRPDLPAGISGIVKRCLSKAPEQRFSSIDELAAALTPFAAANEKEASKRVRRLSSIPVGMAQTVLSSETLTPIASATPSRGVRKPMAVAAAIALLSAIGWLLVMRKPDPPRPQPPTVTPTVALPPIEEKSVVEVSPPVVKDESTEKPVRPATHPVRSRNTAVKPGLSMPLK